MKAKKIPSAPASLEAPDALRLLHTRFAEHAHLHPGLEWADVLRRLENQPAKRRALREMEHTGGEPAVVGRDAATGHILIMDCSPETPKGRVSLCYDPDALAARKEHKPRDSAVGLARAMGIELLTEEDYFALQKLGEFDTRTSSWLRTPPEIRARGGAIFGDRRFGRVFIYHNGAESYYGVRGFRGVLRV